MKNLLVLDGNSIINRAFYGIRPLSTKSGIPTNAVFGFLNILKKHIDHVKPDYMICAFDTHAPTFRHEMFDGYKGNRKGMPEELAMQMPYARRAAAALGFTVMECPGFEADDILGTASAMAAKTGDIHTFLLTGDRDSLQLISDSTTVILMKTKEDILFDRERFTEEYGITPELFVDVKALMGDSSDNIPGVSGIGEKTALKLIAASGGLDELYASENFFSSTPSVCKKLAEGKDMAYKSRDLAKICCDATPVLEELSDGFDALCTEADTAALLALFDELEFTGMAKRFGIDETAAAPSAEVCEKASFVQKPVSDASFSDGTTIAFAADGDSFALSADGDTVYTGNFAEDGDRLAKILATAKIVCHDLKNTLHTLDEKGLGTADITCAFDVMLGAYLINPGKNAYPLAAILEEYGLGSVTDTSGVCAALLTVCGIMKETLSAENMLSLLHEIEIPLASVLYEMESVGFKIDCGGIAEYTRLLTEAENTLADNIWAHAGRSFNINSPKQLGEVLFEELSLPAGKKTKTGYSTDAETLEGLRPYHPIIGDILLYRQIAKLRGTYGEPLVKLADERSRIHTKLNQTGTATGRLSSADPNLQNIPIRMELGRELRKYFIPEGEDYVLIDADYSQIELRLLAELSGDCAMRAAFLDGEDFHTMVAAQVFGVDVDDVTPELRRRAKAVNFGIIYGIGEFSLSRDLGTTRKQAAEYIANYLAAYPDVDRYLKETVRSAKETGATSTMFGRQRKIPELSAKNRNLVAFGERVAMNSPIQGSAADIIKIAMIRVHRKLRDEGIDARLIMQVHDELIVESHIDCAERACEILVTEMENAVELNVPLTVEAAVGRNWYEAH
ncbi:MAG: DNA polymerase I [Ruminococcaceae bacterium]|nr:DNA polymerase I [Oscillospiraceae bacterium]